MGVHVFFFHFSIETPQQVIKRMTEEPLSDEDEYLTMIDVGSESSESVGNLPPVGNAEPGERRQADQPIPPVDFDITNLYVHSEANKADQRSSERGKKWKLENQVNSTQSKIHI